MANIGENQSNLSIFDPPEISVESRIYSTLHRPKCGSKLVSGSFGSIATIPNHGTKVSTVPSNVDYSVFRTTGTEFSSSMVGLAIRFSNLNIDSLSYTGTDGKPQTFTGAANADFTAKVKSVLTSDVLKIDRPLVVSNTVLKTAAQEEDSPYFENFKEYYVTNITRGSYEIVHAPRVVTSEMSSSQKLCSVLGLTFKNLVFNSMPKTYRVLKRSLTIPETATCIASGNVEPNDLLMTLNESIDFRHGGKFYSAFHAQKYWLASSGLTFDHSPQILIDSITLNCSNDANENETSYLIFKEDTGEVSRNSQYITSSYQTSSFWYTNPKLFANFEVEPNTYYSCSIENPHTISYTGSIEVVNNGSVLNSNAINLLKNTTYNLSIDWANVKTNSPDDFELLVYFITTSTKGSIQKFLLGSIDSSVATTYTGTYTSQFFSPVDMFGTVIVVPKKLTSIAIANISLKPYQDADYALDSFTIQIPFTPVLQNEKIELVADIFNVTGIQCCNSFRTLVHVDPNGWTEQLFGTAVIIDVDIDGGAP